MLFSHDSGHHPHGGTSHSFIVMLISYGISFVVWLFNTILAPLLVKVWVVMLGMEPFWDGWDHWATRLLQLLSFVSLFIGIVAGLMTINEKVKNKKKPK